MLKFLKSNEEEYGNDKLQTTHNGKLGGTYDQLIYIQNDDPTVYYTDISIYPVSSTYDDIRAEFGETGFGVKLLNKADKPSELEWDTVRAGEPIYLEDIGSTNGADITSLSSIWVRVICPGLTPAQIKSNMSIKCVFSVKQLGT